MTRTQSDLSKVSNKKRLLNNKDKNKTKNNNRGMVFESWCWTKTMLIEHHLRGVRHPGFVSLLSPIPPIPGPLVPGENTRWRQCETACQVEIVDGVRHRRYWEIGAVKHLFGPICCCWEVKPDGWPFPLSRVNPLWFPPSQINSFQKISKSSAYPISAAQTSPQTSK